MPDPYNDTYTDTQTSNSVLTGNVENTTTTYLRTYLRTTVHVIGSGGGDLGGHYVSTSGNDGNPGSYAFPWRTITYGVQHITPGETLWIRGGTYIERPNGFISGTVGNQIIISGYPGETVIIDGNAVYPAGSGGLLQVYASYITLKDFSVTNERHTTGTAGIWINDGADYCIIDNVNVYNTWGTGIVLQGDYATVQYCHVHDCVQMNYHGTMGVGWGAGITTGGEYPSIYPAHNTIKYNVSYMNWGEGINPYESDNTLIEHNIAYDNWSTQVYVSDMTHGTIDSNLFYRTGAMDGWDGGQIGIVMGDESGAPVSHGNIIINNLVYGCRRNLYYWLGGAGGGLVDDVIANNTFVNSTVVCVEIYDATHSNTIIKNNIVRQDNALPCVIPNTDSGITWDYNCWSKAVDADAQGANDIVDDAELAETDNWTNPLWYKILGTSPAIGQGIAIAEVTKDYWETDRADPPCIGAHEFV